jgi:hypothetical protein
MTAIRVNNAEVDRILKGFSAKQLPFAIAKALTVTAQDAKREADKQLEKVLDRPTPFTKRAFGIARATKQRQRSSVFVKDIQAEYLQYAIEGGTRRPDRKAILVPVNIRLNKYGNIPSKAQGKKIRALLAKPNVFQGSVRGVSGIWQRTNKNKKLKLLIRLEDKVRYKRRLNFYGMVQGVAVKRLPINLKHSLNEAIRTAR